MVMVGCREWWGDWQCLFLKDKGKGGRFWQGRSHVPLWACETRKCCVSQALRWKRQVGTGVWNSGERPGLQNAYQRILRSCHTWGPHLQVWIQPRGQTSLSFTLAPGLFSFGSSWQARGIFTTYFKASGHIFWTGPWSIYREGWW